MSQPHNPQCRFCNRFMSWLDVQRGVCWTPFGGPTDSEPPEPEHAHRACWEHADETRRALIRCTSWQKPVFTDNGTIRIA